MTAFLNWNESFLTRLPSVDDRLQRLIRLINDFGEIVTSEAAIEPASFAELRKAILEYAELNFSEEEELMQGGHVDARFFDRHRAAHQSFMREAQALLAVSEEHNPARARQALENLVQWLTYHILATDQSMARQLQAIANGQSAASAFEDAEQYIRSGNGPLLAALTALLETVSKRNGELRRLVNELERRCHQRTLELESANHRLAFLSTTDELTGLPNRRFALLALRQVWDEARRYGRALSLLMLDADRFKEVNERYGQAEGDALLVAMATSLRSAIRSSDIACRLGSDEFLVICPQTACAGAAEVASKILAAQQPFCTTDDVQCWNGNISIGVAEKRDFMEDPDRLLQSVDQALGAAKRQGGGCVVACLDALAK